MSMASGTKCIDRIPTYTLNMKIKCWPEGFCWEEWHLGTVSGASNFLCTVNYFVQLFVEADLMVLEGFWEMYHFLTIVCNHSLRPDHLQQSRKN